MSPVKCTAKSKLTQQWACSGAGVTVRCLLQCNYDVVENNIAGSLENWIISYLIHFPITICQLSTTLLSPRAKQDHCHLQSSLDDNVFETIPNLSASSYGKSLSFNPVWNSLFALESFLSWLLKNKTNRFESQANQNQRRLRLFWFFCYFWLVTEGIMAVGETDHPVVDRKESTESVEDSRMRFDSESSNDDAQFNCLEPLGFDDLRRYADLSAR